MSNGTGDLAFKGFTSQALDLLGEIKARQDREWFAQHKQEFKTLLQQPLGQLVDQVAFRCAIEEIPFTGTAKQNQFRIYRDIRFSKDKSPFKTHVSCTWSRSGQKNTQGALYLQIEPKKSFMAAGFFFPDNKQLKRLRQGLVERPEKWADTLEALEENGLEPDRTYALKSAPRGFAQAPEHLAPDLRLTSWILQAPLGDKLIRSPDVSDRIIRFAQDSLPLIRFGWDALATPDS